MICQQNTRFTSLFSASQMLRPTVPLMGNANCLLTYPLNPYPVLCITQWPVSLLDHNLLVWLDSPIPPKLPSTLEIKSQALRTNTWWMWPPAPSPVSLPTTFPTCCSPYLTFMEWIENTHTSAFRSLRLLILLPGRPTPACGVCPLACVWP